MRRSVIEIAFQNKCSDRSMEVKLAALLENYDRQTDQPTGLIDWVKRKFTTNNLDRKFIRKKYDKIRLN